MHLPPYASCLLFELYEANANHYIQIFYKKSTEVDIPALRIPNCGYKCPLEKVFELYDGILPTQSYDKECELRAGEELPTGGNPESFSV